MLHPHLRFIFQVSIQIDQIGVLIFLKNAGSDQIAGGSKLTLEKAILDHTSTDHDPHLIQSAPTACPGRRGLILQHKNRRTPKSTRGHFLLWALSECLGKCVAYLCISNFAVHVLSKNIACNELQRTKEAKACKSWTPTLTTVKS